MNHLRLRRLLIFTKVSDNQIGLGQFRTVTKSNKLSGEFRVSYDHLRLETREIEARYFLGWINKINCYQWYQQFKKDKEKELRYMHE